MGREGVARGKGRKEKREEDGKARAAGRTKVFPFSFLSLFFGSRSLYLCSFLPRLELPRSEPYERQSSRVSLCLPTLRSPVALRNGAEALHMVGKESYRVERAGVVRNRDPGLRARRRHPASAVIGDPLAV
jgi:hypothetical protein